MKIINKIQTFVIAIISLVTLFSATPALAIAPGINIAGNYGDFTAAANMVGPGGWITVLGAIGDCSSVASFTNENVNLVLRGDPGNATREHAQSWCRTLGEMDTNGKAIYFMPWNEPNTALAGDGLAPRGSPQTVANYVGYLGECLNDSGLLNDKVRLLSPAPTEHQPCPENEPCQPPYQDYYNAISNWGQIWGHSRNTYDIGNSCTAATDQNSGSWGNSCTRYPGPSLSKPEYQVESGVIDFTFETDREGRPAPSVEYTGDQYARHIRNLANLPGGSGPASNAIMATIFSYDPEGQQPYNIFNEYRSNGNFRDAWDAWRAQDHGANISIPDDTSDPEVFQNWLSNTFGTPTEDGLTDGRDAFVSCEGCGFALDQTSCSHHGNTGQAASNFPPWLDPDDYPSSIWGGPLTTRPQSCTVIENNRLTSRPAVCGVCTPFVPLPVASCGGNFTYNNTYPYASDEGSTCNERGECLFDVSSDTDNYGPDAAGSCQILQAPFYNCCERMSDEEKEANGVPWGEGVECNPCDHCPMAPENCDSETYQENPITETENLIVSKSWQSQVTFNASSVILPFAGNDHEESREKYIADYLDGTTYYISEIDPPANPIRFKPDYEYYNEIHPQDTRFFSYTGVFNKLAPQQWIDYHRVRRLEEQTLAIYFGTRSFDISLRNWAGDEARISNFMSDVIPPYPPLAPVDPVAVPPLAPNHHAAFVWGECDYGNYLLELERWRTTRGGFWERMWPYVPTAGREDTPGQFAPYIQQPGAIYRIVDNQTPATPQNQQFASSQPFAPSEPVQLAQQFESCADLPAGSCCGNGLSCDEFGSCNQTSINCEPSPPTTGNPGNPPPIDPPDPSEIPDPENTPVDQLPGYIAPAPPFIQMQIPHLARLYGSADITRALLQGYDFEDAQRDRANPPQLPPHCGQSNAAVPSPAPIASQPMTPTPEFEPTVEDKQVDSLANLFASSTPFSPSQKSQPQESPTVLAQAESEPVYLAQAPDDGGGNATDQSSNDWLDQLSGSCVPFNNEPPGCTATWDPDANDGQGDNAPGVLSGGYYINLENIRIRNGQITYDVLGIQTCHDIANCLGDTSFTVNGGPWGVAGGCGVGGYGAPAIHPSGNGPFPNIPIGGDGTYTISVTARQERDINQFCVPQTQTVQCTIEVLNGRIADSVCVQPDAPPAQPQACGIPPLTGVPSCQGTIRTGPGDHLCGEETYQIDVGIDNFWSANPYGTSMRGPDGNTPTANPDANFYVYGDSRCSADIACEECNCAEPDKLICLDSYKGLDCNDTCPGGRLPDGSCPSGEVEVCSEETRCGEYLCQGPNAQDDSITLCDHGGGGGFSECRDDDADDADNPVLDPPTHPPSPFCAQGMTCKDSTGQLNRCCILPYGADTFLSGDQCDFEYPERELLHTSSREVHIATNLPYLRSIYKHLVDRGNSSDRDNLFKMITPLRGQDTNPDNVPWYDFHNGEATGGLTIVDLGAEPSVSHSVTPNTTPFFFPYLGGIQDATTFVRDCLTNPFSAITEGNGCSAEHLEDPGTADFEVERASNTAIDAGINDIINNGPGDPPNDLEICEGNPQIGDTISAGTVIAKMGGFDEPCSTGAHLHFGVTDSSQRDETFGFYRDPATFLAAGQDIIWAIGSDTPFDFTGTWSNWPMNPTTIITQGFGFTDYATQDPSPYEDFGGYHNGIDMVNYSNHDIIAPQDGIFQAGTIACRSGNTTNYVKLDHSDTLSTWYLHVNYLECSN